MVGQTDSKSHRTSARILARQAAQDVFNESLRRSA
jgi:hypothetical protein